ncbi:ACP S-malonyltransferase [Anaerorhabdus sp.]|uniref:ACP S-malonyltransferase n=1 Tax=Anaerorhabdus sp. TaxID=1872524 RepID=UPI002FC6F127
MKIAFVFAGQGAQYIGMGKDNLENSLSFKEVFDACNENNELATICFEDADRLNATRDAQWAIYSISMGIVNMLKQEGIVPEGCIGLSLGEYSAYGCAGAYSINEGVMLTKKRGALMQDTIEKTTSGMAAILALSADKIEQACLEASNLGIVSVANYNAPDQIVITGEELALEKAMQNCIEFGARRAIKLQVSGAFHSALLISAQADLNKALTQVNWQETTLPIYTNCTGDVTEDRIDSLTQQLVSPVRFQKGIEKMMMDGFDTFIEIGPKTTCSSFIKKIAQVNNKEVTICNVDDYKSFIKTKEIIQGGQA